MSTLGWQTKTAIKLNKLPLFFHDSSIWNHFLTKVDCVASIDMIIIFKCLRWSGYITIRFKMTKGHAIVVCSKPCINTCRWPFWQNVLCQNIFIYKKIGNSIGTYLLKNTSRQRSSLRFKLCHIYLELDVPQAEESVEDNISILLWTKMQKSPVYPVFKRKQFLITQDAENKCITFYFKQWCG